MSDAWLERMKRHLAAKDSGVHPQTTTDSASPTTDSPTPTVDSAAPRPQTTSSSTGPLDSVAHATRLGDSLSSPASSASSPTDSASQEALPGKLLLTPNGSVRVIRQVYTTAWPYSARPVEQVLGDDVVSGAKWLKDPRLAGFRRDEALFLDVEATGLFQDANNVAFLVGLAWFEPQGLVCEQLFLEEPDEEPALLHRLLERLEGKRFLVSYNGKAYDKTVLESRFVLNRLMDREQAHLRLLPHLDLLHLGRRIFAGTLPEHRLGTMERSVLGFDRGEDVPGALVPRYYYEWLLNQRCDRIRDVIHHNLVDVLTLVHLADRLLGMVKPGVTAGDPQLDANLGWLLLSSGFKAESVFSLRSALSGVPAEEVFRVAARLESALGGARAPLEQRLQVWQLASQRNQTDPQVAQKLATVSSRARSPRPR